MNIDYLLICIVKTLIYVLNSQSPYGSYYSSIYSFVWLYTLYVISGRANRAHQVDYKIRVELGRSEVKIAIQTTRAD